MGVEADRLYGCHDDHHAKSDRNEQHDDMLGPVFQSQLLLLVIVGLNDTWRTRCGRLPVLLRPVVAASTSSASASASITSTSSSSSCTAPGPCPGYPGFLWLLGGLRGRTGLLLVLSVREDNHIALTSTILMYGQIIITNLGHLYKSMGMNGNEKSDTEE